MKKIFLIVVFFVFVSPASAATYPTMADAWAACIATDIASEGGSYENRSCFQSGERSVKHGFPWNPTGAGQTFTAATGCPVDEPFDPSIGDCAPPPPPPCEAPNYIDPDSGECVAPKEVCFTDLESMADECVFIGEPDPDLPDGCVEFQGDQVCLTDDPNCYDVNGKQVCSTPNSVCGFKNGAYECISPVAEGCGYFNGEMVCFTPDGQKVDQDSPDHPQNGGNLDGDDTNDPTDARTPEEGGNPDRQPIDTTGQGDGATEGTAKEQLKALRQLRDDVRNQNKANEGNGAALEQGISSGIGSAGDSATGQLDDHIDGIDTTAPMTADDLSGIESTVSNLFGVSTQCTDIIFGTDELFYTITCQQMDKIRDLLGFLLYGFTVIRLFQIALRPAAKGTP